MKTACFLLFCVVAASMAYEIVTDGEQEYLLVPVDDPAPSRSKRQTNFNFDTQSRRAQLSHTGTLHNSNNHHLSGTGNISKGIPRGPLSLGGSLDYTHKPSGSIFSAGAQHTRGFGTNVQLSQTGTLFNNKNHHLSGTGSISKSLPRGPVGMGGNLDYIHKPSGSSIGVGAHNVRGFGTDLGISGRYNFVNKPNTQIFAEGQYGRHFGGPFGTGRPNYGVGVGLQHRF